MASIGLVPLGETETKERQNIPIYKCMTTDCTACVEYKYLLNPSMRKTMARAKEPRVHDPMTCYLFECIFISSLPSSSVLRTESRCRAGLPFPIGWPMARFSLRWFQLKERRDSTAFPCSERGGRVSSEMRTDPSSARASDKLLLAYLIFWKANNIRYKINAVKIYWAVHVSRPRPSPYAFSSFMYVYVST